jgi:TrmH family RNA methyltransferase
VNIASERYFTVGISFNKGSRAGVVARHDNRRQGRNLKAPSWLDVLRDFELELPVFREVSDMSARTQKTSTAGTADRRTVEAGLVEHFQRARGAPDLTVLEGFHAVKHALRFGAELLEVVVTDPEQALALASEMAPDLVEILRLRMRSISAESLAPLAPQTPPTGIMATAKRPRIEVTEILARPQPAPIVLLENPQRMGNLGACIRVAAAAEALAVFSTGRNDPWHPDAVRGAAGLHFALPVVHLSQPVVGDRPLIAIDPGGDELQPERLPPRSILAFGTERHGLSDALLASAALRLRIPMKAGVSSLNLATSVSAVLYAARFAAADRL